MMALVELSGEEAKFILDNIFVVEVVQVKVAIIKLNLIAWKLA